MDDESIIELTEEDAAEIEAAAERGEIEIPDNTFSTYFDDKEKTLSVCAMNLRKDRAKILVSVILHQIQEW